MERLVVTPRLKWKGLEVQESEVWMVMTTNQR